MAACTFLFGCSNTPIATKSTTGGGKKYGPPYRCGFINRNGTFVIEPKYISADPFHKGRARVALLGENNLPYTDGSGLYRYICINQTGNSIPQAKSGISYQIANKANLLRIQEPIIENARFWHSPLSRTYWVQSAAFSNGLMPVCFDTAAGPKWGYINNLGKIVIAPQFAECSNFQDGLAIAALASSTQQIDIDSPTPSENNLYGFIDTSGVFVIKPVFQMVDAFSEGLAAVKQGGKWGYINRQGHLVVRASYCYAFPFYEGLAGVALTDDTLGAVDTANGSNCKLAFINQSGEIVIQSKYWIPLFGARFSEGLAAVGVKVSDSDSKDILKFGYINSHGDLVIPPRFYSAGDFSEGLANVCFLESDKNNRAYNLKSMYSSKTNRLWRAF